MEIETPLGEDLLFFSMTAREELGRLGEFQVQMLSLKPDISMDAMLGQNVTVKLEVQAGGPYRHFNGHVVRFSQGPMYGRYYTYQAVVRPWLWFLTRTADCRIFQELAAPDIIKMVFADHGMADFALELVGSFHVRTYCVQYRETDFNFVSRLMEEEGIYYYTKHSQGHNKLVLTNATSTHAAASGCASLPFIAPGKLTRADIDHVSSWDFAQEVQPGVFVHDDYDFERPKVELQTKKALSRSYSPSSYEVYDYPGLYVQKGDGQVFADTRINEFGTQFEQGHGVSNARNLTTGYLLTLEKMERGDQNREYLVTAANHALEFSAYEGLPAKGGATYRCSFTAMSTQQLYRPRRSTPKPFVQGPQTAVVVGPPGDEIYTDKYGRVKVQFHWDRYGKMDQNSSCWVRVSSPWAGKGWGHVNTPRIGQEVVVDFLEGDPDQPLITGRVYNADNPPPFNFPAGAVLSGVKSDTHKGSGFNEMSLDDTAGKERVFIHGQYNMDTVVLHDQTTTVHHCRTDRIDVDDSESVGKNQSLMVGVDRTKTVVSNETISIGANRTSTVNMNETATVTLQRTHTVGVNETITVGAAQEVTIGALQAITVGASQVTTVGNNASMSVGKDESRNVGSNRSTTVGKDDSTKVGKNYVLDAGDSITIKTGSASITMKKDGTISIKGKDISIEGSGKINVKASSDVVIKGSKVGIN